MYATQINPPMKLWMIPSFRSPFPLTALFNGNSGEMLSVSCRKKTHMVASRIRGFVSIRSAISKAKLKFCREPIILSDFTYDDSSFQSYIDTIREPCYLSAISSMQSESIHEKVSDESFKTRPMIFGSQKLRDTVTTKNSLAPHICVAVAPDHIDSAELCVIKVETPPSSASVIVLSHGDITKNSICTPPTSATVTVVPDHRNITKSYTGQIATPATTHLAVVPDNRDTESCVTGPQTPPNLGSVTEQEDVTELNVIATPIQSTRATATDFPDSVIVPGHGDPTDTHEGKAQTKPTSACVNEVPDHGDSIETYGGKTPPPTTRVVLAPDHGDSIETYGGKTPPPATRVVLAPDHGSCSDVYYCETQTAPTCVTTTDHENSTYTNESKTQPQPSSASNPVTPEDIPLLEQYQPPSTPSIQATAFSLKPRSKSICLGSIHPTLIPEQKRRSNSDSSYFKELIPVNTAVSNVPSKVPIPEEAEEVKPTFQIFTKTDGNIRIAYRTSPGPGGECDDYFIFSVGFIDSIGYCAPSLLTKRMRDFIERLCRVQLKHGEFGKDSVEGYLNGYFTNSYDFGTRSGSVDFDLDRGFNFRTIKRIRDCESLLREGYHAKGFEVATLYGLLNEHVNSRYDLPGYVCQGYVGAFMAGFFEGGYIAGYVHGYTEFATWFMDNCLKY